MLDWHFFRVREFIIKEKYMVFCLSLAIIDVYLIGEISFVQKMHKYSKSLSIKISILTSSKIEKNIEKGNIYKND